MNILFLDDDENRHKEFWKWIDNINRKDYYITPVYSYKQFTQVALLQEDWDIMFLDHDLGYEDQLCIPGVNNKFKTGSDVAQYMVDNSIKPKKIIIHSYNAEGARNMIGIFKDHDMEATYHPFDSNLRDHL